MADEGVDSAEPVLRSFNEHLEVLAGEASVLDLSDADRALVRTGAASLLAGSEPITKTHLKGLGDPLALAAAAAAGALRAEEILAFWAPLLQLCKDGTDRTPLRDLKSAVVRADVVVDGLIAATAEEGEHHALLVAALERARATSASLGQWMPGAGASSLSATPYDPAPLPGRSSTAPLPTAAAPPEPEPAETPAGQKRLLIGVVLLLLFSVGAQWIKARLDDRLPDVGIEVYKDAMPELRSFEMVGDELQLVVGGEWLRKSRDEATEDVLRLLEVLSGQRYNRVLFKSDTGQSLVRIGSDGGMTWVLKDKDAAPE